jgi:hypothetical protein
MYENFSKAGLSVDPRNGSFRFDVKKLDYEDDG